MSFYKFSRLDSKRVDFINPFRINNSAFYNNKDKYYVFLVVCLLLCAYIIVSHFIVLFIQKGFFSENLSPPIFIKDENFDKSLISQIFTIGLVAPILEEYLFRYFIILKRNAYFWGLYFFSLTFLILDFFIRENTDINYLFRIITNYSIWTLNFIYLAFIYFKERKINRNILHSKKYFTFFIFLLSFSFTLLHIPNYIWTFTNYLPTLMEFIAMFFFSIYLFKLRIQCGILYAILLHAVNNISFVLLTFFFF